MAVFKRVLCTQRLRQVPRQFSWIDHRLVRDRHISRCSANALALYLFLVTVADGQGLSYYADQTICRLLPLDSARDGPLDAWALDRARRELIANELIAYQRPLYQALALGPAQPGAPTKSLPRMPSSSPRLRPPHAPDAPDAGPHPLARILRQLAELDSAQSKPFDSAQSKPFDSAQSKPFDSAQSKPFDSAQDKPFDSAGDKP